MVVVLQVHTYIYRADCLIPIGHKTILTHVAYLKFKDLKETSKTIFNSRSNLLLNIAGLCMMLFLLCKTAALILDY